MQTKTLFSILFLTLATVAKAQFAYPIQQDAIDFQKRALLVNLIEEDEKIVKGFKSKYGKNSPELTKKLEAYTQQIQKQNELIKAAVTRYWKANKSVEFKTHAELEDMLKDAKTLRNYGVLNVGWKTEFQHKGNTAQPVEVFALVAYVAEATDRKLSELKRSPTQKTDYIFKIAFPTDNIQLSDYIFAVQQFNYHIKNATGEGQTLERFRNTIFVPPFNKAGYEVIKKKTLMLPANILEGHDAAELKTIYTFPSEVVDPKFFEEAIEQQFAKYLYVTKVWSDRQTGFTNLVINASEGIVLSEMSVKSADPKAPPHLIDADPSTAGFYKNEIGVSIATLTQLQHILEPKN